jgi:5,5'-dehydrodivanillate O-demethylase oxygenase subunit
MQSVEQAQRLTSQRDDFAFTGPGTLAGAYLRRFWNPLYHSIDLKVRRPVPLQIMGETFTLYRGEGGTVHLVEARCPHRGTQLSSAWVEGDALRCFYHGWKFESDGRCSEQPAEESRFCDKVPIRVWPVREYLGLIFAYLGDDTPPEFQIYPQFEYFQGLVEVDSYWRPCNYAQNMENALDMSHVAFTHSNNRVSFGAIGLGRNLKAEESDWGVVYTFTRDDGQLRIQQFGMPNIFYMTALPNDPEIGWQESLFWWVPIDDESHMQFSIHRVPVAGEAAERVHARRQRRRAEIDIAHQDACAQVLTGRKRIEDFDSKRVDLVRLQDDVAQVGQGLFANRREERMGRADVGVAAIRRLWRRELANLAANKPLKTWRRTDNIKPRAWNIADSLARFSEEDARAESQSPADVIDIRPFVEIEVQLKALQSLPGRRPSA